MCLLLYLTSSCQLQSQHHFISQPKPSYLEMFCRVFRITKKFEFTYPGTTCLFAPGSPGNHAGGTPSSSHATTSGQQFYNRLASGTLGLTGGGEERKTSGSGGYHSLDTVPSSGVLGGSTSLSTTLPQSHTR